MNTKQQIMNLLQLDQPDQAEILCRRAIEGTGRKDSELLLMMAAIQAAAGNMEEVRHYCQAAVDIDPHSVPGYFNLAIACQNLGDTGSAITAYRRTIELQPDHAGAHGNLGIMLSDKGEHEEAARYLKQALAQQPGNSNLHYHLGISCRRAGRYNEAEQHFRYALQHAPGEPRALNELGSLLLARDRPDEAVLLFSTLMQRIPESFVAHFNMSMALRRLGRHTESLSHSFRAVQLEPDHLQARQAFVQSVQMAEEKSISDGMHKEIGATLGNRGIDSQQLFTAAAGYIKSSTIYKQLFACTSSGNTRRFSATLLDLRTLPFLQDVFLQALLSNTIVTDLELEDLLTMARKSLLQAFVNGDHGHMAGPLLPYLSAQAQQCFNNEYAWQVGDEEKYEIELLYKILDKACATTPLTGEFNAALLMLLASYEALGAHTLLACVCTDQHAAFPCPVQDVIRRQVIEPAEEHALAQQVCNLTRVTDAISCSVQDQYEDSPYPRWINTTIHKPRPLREVLGEQFPSADLPAFTGDRIDMLIAGCGTGSHAIQSSSRFSNVLVTAIDLSRASLAYAMRKTREYNITNISYYQADILELAGLDSSFQIIESVGVLHHMQDPAQGLQILTSLLDPHGIFCIGLYSTTARRHISVARRLVIELDLPASPAGIREARQVIKQIASNDPLHNILNMQDFYSTSECRDLIFHVQEHTFTLLQIEQLLQNAGLEFIGFELADPVTIHHYRNSYPADTQCTNLQNWHWFELDNPDTFIGMYNFWCKKSGGEATPAH